MMIRRFGFRQLADVRDHRYTMPMVLESTPKDQREVVAWEIGKILDQGNEGACVGFGCRALLNASPFRQSEGPTAREIYLEARIGDEFDDIAVPSGTSVRAGLNVLKTHGLIESYVWATSIEDVLQFIAKKGPVVLGINWYGYSTAADGRIPMHGTRVGGHCVLGFSFDRKENVLGIQNSWGYSYGIQGCGYISLADLDREMRRGGVVAGVTERTIA